MVAAFIKKHPGHGDQVDAVTPEIMRWVDTLSRAILRVWPITPDHGPGRRSEFSRHGAPHRPRAGGRNRAKTPGCHRNREPGRLSWPTAIVATPLMPTADSCNASRPRRTAWSGRAECRATWSRWSATYSPSTPGSAVDAAGFLGQQASLCSAPGFDLKRVHTRRL